MNFLHLTKDKLDLNATSELVAHESCGAISFFVGTTRDNFDDKKARLSFECKRKSVITVYFTLD